jgi:hypothetical protein
MRLHNAGVQLRLEDAGDMVLLHLGMNMQSRGARARRSRCRPASAANAASADAQRFRPAR